MLSDIEMKRILARMFRKQKRRPPPIQLSCDGAREPAGPLEEFRRAVQLERAI
jgi:hypothetical protein